MKYLKEHRFLTSLKEMGCLREVLTIVSMLSVDTIFYTPRNKKDEADRSRFRFFNEDGTQLKSHNEEKRKQSEQKLKKFAL